MIKTKQILAAFTLSILTAFAYSPVVIASEANSTNFGVSEVRFGSGGELRACSTTYCAKQSAGELTVGNTRSTNYQAQAGGETSREPVLEVSVGTSTVVLGDLTPASTGSGSTTFSVKSYLAYGYDVYLDGSSPRHKASGNVLSTLSTPASSQAGVEQFGVNLRQNTVPSVGANAAHIPDSTFSFGAPTASYNTVNSFKYVAGDIIASSTSSSGQTNYTMSMIANVSTVTKAGAYGGRLTINVVPTF